MANEAKDRKDKGADRKKVLVYHYSKKEIYWVRAKIVFILYAECCQISNKNQVSAIILKPIIYIEVFIICFHSIM